ncbi:hypothetical protein ACFP1Z_01840 [Streptomyces gamaensis]|uniref:Uncharacterized protein n=1 Tax=Streptomyces gamaensis TaxID=1763542 RepID=A0ABW0YSW5_9ACTN
MGRSVVPGTEDRHATAAARAVVEPRCTVRPTPPPPPSAPATVPPSVPPRTPSGPPPPGRPGDERKLPLGLVCDGVPLTLDPLHPDDFAKATTLFAVHLVD